MESTFTMYSESAINLQVSLNYMEEVNLDFTELEMKSKLTKNSSLLQTIPHGLEEASTLRILRKFLLAFMQLLFSLT